MYVWLSYLVYGFKLLSVWFQDTKFSLIIVHLVPFKEIRTLTTIELGRISK